MSDNTKTEFVQTVAGITERWEWHNDDDHNTRMTDAVLRRGDTIYAMKVVAAIAETHPLFPIPSISNWSNGQVPDRALGIYCNSAAEMRTVVNALGDGDKMVEDDGDPYILFQWDGIYFKARRSDLTCEFVPELDEDGNEVMEEITVREVVAPEKVREVVKTVAKTVRKCPPMLG